MFVTYKVNTSNYNAPSLMDIIFDKQSQQPEYNQPTQYITRNIDRSASVEKIWNDCTYIAQSLLDDLKQYQKSKDFTEENKFKFYQKFRIPKRKGGYRELIDPTAELKQLQRRILFFLYDTLKILPHNSAHGFVKCRDSVTNAEVHKKARHIISLDLQNFFPSITSQILNNQLSKIHIFSYRNVIPLIDELLQTIIHFATFEGVLPQGSPLSPYLSNLVMLEFDYSIINKIKEGTLPFFWYSRYADDMTFSSKNYHQPAKLITVIKELLQTIFGDSIQLNESKTKVLKNTSKCFITGVKLNKDNNLTYGHEKKKELKHNLFNLFIKQINNDLTTEEVQHTLGVLAYMHRIEPQYTNYISNKMLRKFNSQSATLSQHFSNYL